MPFPVGADVVVRTLRNKHGRIIAAGRGGRYRVQVEGLTMSCREQDLAAPSGDSKGKRRKRAASSKVRHREDATAGRVPGESGRQAGEPAAPPGRVDLHGLVVGEGIARVVDAIDRALQRGAARVEIVHGKGSGRMRDAVHRQLAALSVVAAFKLDPDNAGVTWVYL